MQFYEKEVMIFNLLTVSKKCNDDKKNDDQTREKLHVILPVLE